jgi:ribosomal protein S18 acetylase RimI-like enzyme
MLIHIKTKFEIRLVRPPKIGCLYLANIAINPAYRGKGLGRQLIEYANQIANRRGIKTLALDVRADNTNAIELYTRNGYKELKLNKSFTNKLDDHIYMEKSLSA